MVFQVECGNIKKRKAFCLRVTDGNKQHVHSSKEYRNLFCQVSNYNVYDGLETKRFQLDGRVGVLDLLGRNTFSGQMGSSS